MDIELNDAQKIKILCSDDLYSVMQNILLREGKIDQDREHFWTICLDNANRILNIELISLGNINSTTVIPMEVFSFPLQKRTVKLMIVHNHPSGELEPSEADKDLTDRLIQVGKIVKVPVLDHLVISTKNYYSFLDDGVMDELEKSLKYVPVYRQKEMAVEHALDKKSIEMAKAMKKEGLPIKTIVKISGLSKSEVEELKLD
ncbi:MAG: DNA repair protein [Flavobacteriales bacterium]|nr:DNA repair protein [Flavobacteriales bacterium]